MQEFYYELVVRVPSSQKEIFMDFLSEMCDEAIEEDGDAFILRSESELGDICDNLELFAQELSSAMQKAVTIQTKITKKENRDWIESYKQSIEPLTICSFYIRAPWHEKNEQLLDTIIEPALAFGSGHHESTSLCISALERIVKKGDTLLDVGSGSGILGICAAKLGAEVDFCDTDDMAVEVSRKNFLLNSTNFNESWVGGCSTSKKKYDIVVANIVADILTIIAPDLTRVAKDGSYLLLSGVLDDYKNSVLEAYKTLKLVEDTQKNEWVSLLFRKG